MRCSQPAPSLQPLWKRIAAALFLAAFVGIHLVGVSEQLHEAVHHDAKESSHSCVFLLVSKGDFSASGETVVAPLLDLPSDALVELSSVSLQISAPDHLLLPGRAPPLFLS
jgi:hypothetical protein